MSKIYFLSAAITAFLSAAIPPPALAQAANFEPGYCAQFYPNSDCNSVGPETPGSGKTQDESIENGTSEPAVSPPTKSAKPRKQSHRSASVAAGSKKTDALPK